jgi:hypothetical protein
LLANGCTADASRASVNCGEGVKVHAFLRLKMSEDAKQVFGRRVAIGPKHPHEAVGRDGCRILQLPKPDRGIDIVAQDRAARLLVAGEPEFDCFTKQRLAESRFPVGAFADRFTKIFGPVPSLEPSAVRVPSLTLLRRPTRLTQHSVRRALQRLVPDREELPVVELHRRWITQVASGAVVGNHDGL